MKFEDFKEKFNDLSMDDKVRIYNECVRNLDSDKEILSIYGFEFGAMFDDFQSLLLAVCNGDVDPMLEYFRFDVYGHMESLHDSDIEDMIDDYIEEIFDDKSYWEDYIEDDGVEDEEDED